MTRHRLAALAALSFPVLLAIAPIGQAQEERYSSDTTCKTAQRTAKDYAKFKTEVKRFERGGPPRGPGRRGSAAAFVPAAGVKVVVKLTDQTPQNGNNIVDGKDSDLTNDNGIAKTKLEFNNFGNYRAKVKVKAGGEVVDEQTINFGVADRESGKCDAPLTGRP
jgi:hypothetical protein